MPSSYPTSAEKCLALDVYYAPNSISALLITTSTSDGHSTKPLFYVVNKMRGSRPDVTLHQLSYALRPGDGQATSATPAKRVQDGDAREKKPSRKALFDRTAAETAPVVGVAVLRHTRKRVGLAFGDLAVDSTTTNAAENKTEYGLARPRQLAQTQRWETMRQLDVTGAKYVVTLPSARALKKAGVDIYPRIPTRSTITPSPSSTPSDPRASPSLCGRETDFWDGFDWSTSGNAATPTQCPEIQQHVSSTNNPFRSHDSALTSNSSSWKRASSSSDTFASTSWRRPTPPHAPASANPMKNDLRDTDADNGVELIWKRTHSTSAGLRNAAIYRRLSLANWKLVDERSDGDGDGDGANNTKQRNGSRVKAVFESNGLKSFRKRGVLRIYCADDDGEREGVVSGELEREWDDEWLVFVRGVVLSYCVLEEKLRRS
jgi:hypothetical protein